jgi:hypothetical protein
MKLIHTIMEECKGKMVLLDAYPLMWHWCQMVGTSQLDVLHTNFNSATFAFLYQVQEYAKEFMFFPTALRMS